ncbi:hypothetical protein VTK26DRAFT_8783 [Humicola hyalothermophila]
MLKIAYGLEVDSPDSPWIKLAKYSANAVGKSGALGKLDHGPPATCRGSFPSWSGSCDAGSALGAKTT